MAEEITGLQLKGEIESTPIDVSKYIGKKAKIESFKIMKSVQKGKESHYLNVSTEPMGEHEGKPINASRNFGLKFDEKEGGLGWSSMGKLAIFLNELAVKDYKEIIGKEVTIITTDADANGQKWLTF